MTGGIDLEKWLSMSPDEKRNYSDKATMRARAIIKIGDRISRTMCGGAKGTFIFTGWSDRWLCGKTISDCHATSIYKVNGQPVDFGIDS